MRLSDIDCAGWGRFLNEPNSFEVTRYHLPRSWDYILNNGHIMWRLHHDGTGDIQVDPPGGLALTKAERFQSAPSFMVWLKPDDNPAKAFTNFFRPVVEPGRELRAPDGFSCVFSPDSAHFELEHEQWLVKTDCRLIDADTAVVMSVEVVNVSERTRNLEIIPALRPYATSATLAPWDVPELYQSIAAFREEHPFFLLRSMDPKGVLTNRTNVMAVFDLEASCYATDYSVAIGAGSWERPAALFDSGNPAWRKIEPVSYGNGAPANMLKGRRSGVLLSKRTELSPGQSFSLSMAFGQLPSHANGSPPSPNEIRKGVGWLEAPAYSCRQVQPGRSVSLPDGALSDYINTFLNYQGDMIRYRGWPCKMFGTRDAGQDFHCLLATNPGAVRDFLLRIFEIEDTGGGFVRQFSTDGRHGKHDERPYVDSGFWVWELLYNYVCLTRDWALLDEKAPFLDDDTCTSILDHAMRILEFYRTEDNRGEHGLVKIYHGDWNDSVDSAGNAGRGESVMASCMAIIAWKQACRLISNLGDGADVPADAVEVYRTAAETMRTAIRKSALNEEGFVNAVFNDDGVWLFCPRDPDGPSRLNIPANSYAVLAGVFEEGELGRLFARIEETKNEHGYPLFWPPFEADRPIEHVGRVATGDLMPGLGENGTPYNHGCHGFLGRAAGKAGFGDRLYDLLLWMLPYDQERHPLERVKTPPYSIVNVWKTAPGWDGEGGDTFFSGSIPTAMRLVYEDMMGIEPCPEGVLVHPCLPSDWRLAEVTVPYAGTICHFAIEKEAGEHARVMRVEVNGKQVDFADEPLIPAEGLLGQRRNEIAVMLEAG